MEIPKHIKEPYQQARAWKEVNTLGGRTAVGLADGLRDMTAIAMSYDDLLKNGATFEHSKTDWKVEAHKALMEET